jgi:hypothetical protein
MMRTSNCQNWVLSGCSCKTSQNQQKEKGETKKGKRGREPTIVIIFFHITTIFGESSQKLNKIGKTFSSKCGVYFSDFKKGQKY